MKFIELHNNLTNLGDRKIAFVLEGRDAAGKGGFVKFLLNEDVPFTLRHQGMPTPTRTKRWLSDYDRIMPKKSELVIYDRSWHTRSWVQPALNFCTERQYKYHIKNVKAWELKHEAKGVEIVKNWISIDKDTQATLIARRKEFKPYKWSETDEKSVKMFEKITEYKELMFEACPTWNVVTKENSKEKLLDLLIKATGEKA